jgi:hypothetical protein
MFRVEWLGAALEELAALWVRGDSESRRLITAATRAIDEELKSRPEEKGESRAEGERILISDHPTEARARRWVARLML